MRYVAFIANAELPPGTNAYNLPKQDCSHHALVFQKPTFPTRRLGVVYGNSRTEILKNAASLSCKSGAFGEIEVNINNRLDVESVRMIVKEEKQLKLF